MQKGYHLIEPAILAELANKNMDIYLRISILSWLIFLLQNDDEVNSYPIRIDFLVACYTSKFICIGVQYATDDIDEKLGDEIENMIETKCKSYLSDKEDFLDYIINQSDTISKNIAEYENTQCA